MFSRFRKFVCNLLENRLAVLTFACILLFFTLIYRLFVLQIVEGELHTSQFTNKTKKEIVLNGTRGSIYDANGKLLAYDKLSYTVYLENTDEFETLAKKNGTSENEEKNKVIYRLIKKLEKNKDDIITELPIEIKEDETLKFTVSGTRKKQFLREVYGLSDYETLSGDDKKEVDKLLKSSAEEVFQFLRHGEGGYKTYSKMFDISDEYSREDALKIMNIRYMIYLNRFSQSEPIELASNISEESLVEIQEDETNFTGISIKNDSIRVYNDSKYFSHIIGYTGAISVDELEEENEKEDFYDANDTIGKTGLEKSMESYLRGKKGKQEAYIDSMGKVLQVTQESEAQAGSDIYLTIDADLQKYCYDTLERRLAGIILEKLTDRTREDLDASGDILISIQDVYNSFFENGVLDIDKISSKKASDTEKEVAALLKDKKSRVFSFIVSQLGAEAVIQNELEGSKKEYMQYIYDFLAEDGIIDKTLIDTEDETYKKWRQEKTSLRHFLKHAINKEWISMENLELSGNYYSTDEIYEELVNYIKEELKDKTGFDKLLYKAMIQSSELSGRKICSLLLAQKVVKRDSDYEQLESGSIDSYSYISRKIKKMEIKPDQLALDPCSGSVVVTDTKTGNVLAMVTYPSYDNNKLANHIDSKYYESLLENQTKPLYNRATQERKAPGSTFKLLTSIAALQENIISGKTKFETKGIFKKVTPYSRCWIYPGNHGKINVSKAIGVSCNYFFYNLGYKMSLQNGEYQSREGLSILRKYATMFGLDENSGVEIPESSPNIADEDPIRAAIGQSNNAFTATQISRYVTAVANEGDLYSLTLIDKIKNNKGKVIQKNDKEERKTELDIKDSVWDLVHNGMYQVTHSKDSSIHKLYGDFKIKVSGKTGTAQEDKKRANHSLFVSFAPSNKPEVSITTIIPYGYTSSYAAETTKDLYKYYFNILTSKEKKNKNALLPAGGETAAD